MSLPQSTSRNTLTSFHNVALIHGRGYHIPPRTGPWSPFFPIKDLLKGLLPFKERKRKTYPKKKTADHTNNKAPTIEALSRHTSVILLTRETRIEFEEEKLTTPKLTKTNLNISNQTMNPSKSG